MIMIGLQCSPEVARCLTLDAQPNLPCQFREPPKIGLRHTGGPWTYNLETTGLDYSDLKHSKQLQMSRDSKPYQELKLLGLEVNIPNPLHKQILSTKFSLVPHHPKSCLIMTSRDDIHEEAKQENPNNIYRGKKHFLTQNETPQDLSQELTQPSECVPF